MRMLSQNILTNSAYTKLMVKKKTNKNCKAIKYRIYPTEEQKAFFAKNFGHSRFVYNKMLEFCKELHSTGEKYPGVFGMNYHLTTLKQEFPWLKEADATALTSANDFLGEAFERFFSKKGGFPKFHRKKSNASYSSKCVANNIRVSANCVILPKVGMVKARIHRVAPYEWKIKGATVSVNADGTYHVAVRFELPDPVPDKYSSPDFSSVLGMDYKSDGLFCDSEGKVCGMPKYYRESHKKLAKAQRKLSRMIKQNICGYNIVGNKRYPIYKRPIEECKNIHKQKLVIARIQRHIANQRKDYLHKKSAEIANRYDIVCVETLNMRAMSNKGFHNGKATLDNGFGMFLSFLEYKLNDRGKYFVKVDKWFPSSQICHKCGCIHKLDLSERTYVCPDCGFTIDRDYQAAMNIRDEGLRVLKEQLSA